MTVHNIVPESSIAKPEGSVMLSEWVATSFSAPSLAVRRIGCANGEQNDHRERQSQQSASDRGQAHDFSKSDRARAQGPA